MPQPRIGAFLAAAVPAGTRDRARNAWQAVDSEDPLVEPLTGDDPREAGGYQLRGRLGSGAMGQVYLALTPGGRQVAVKMIRAEFGNDERFRARFRQEMAAAQRVHGLFTAQVLEAEPDAPRPWLATSYVPGLSLREAVTRYGPLPPDTVFLMLAGIAEALQAIHAAGIIHRDLKPSNVILAADGPRVIDFGIARADAAPALTGSGSWVGSPWFMAPEQARGRCATPAADVFSLGSLAVYAAAGHPPFGTDGAVAVLNRVLNDPPDLDGCPPDLHSLIERCLAKDPGLRPRPRDIVSACRDRASSGLAFGLSWLPGQMSVAPADSAALEAIPVTPTSAAVPPRVTGPGGIGPDDTDAGGTDAGGAEGTGAGEAGAGEAGPGVTGAGEAGPETTSPSVDRGARPVQPEPPHPPPSPHPVPGKPRQKTKTIAAAVTGAVLLLIVAGGAVALARQGGQQPRAAGGGLARPNPGAQAGTSSPRGTSATSPSSGRDPAKAATARLPRGKHAAPHPAPSAASPTTASPTPEVTLSGRAAFGGTWSGTVSQPAWTVPT
ncbi:MAG TPA: serine/threonine-protein kinase [Streptosporangiaceae bacterium]|nr:serine/threonine-protein kinase [Streptosporangiaceae bacterium]